MTVYDDLLAADRQTNKYDALLEADREAEKQRAAGAVTVGSFKNPDQQAEAMTLARGRAPVGLVYDNLDFFRKPTVDYDKLVKESPKLANWLGDVDNASVAHDDIDALREVERTVSNPATGRGFLRESVLDQLVGGYYDLRSRSTLFDAIEAAQQAQSGQLTPSEHANKYLVMRRMAQTGAEFKAEKAATVPGLVEEAAEFEARAGETQLSAETLEFLDENSGKSVWEAFKVAPAKIIVELGARSGPAMLPGLVSGAALGAVGSTAGPAGAAAGFAAGMGGASGRIEYVASVVEGLRKRGVNVRDPRALAVAVADEGVMAEVHKRAMIRSAVIGGLDAIAGLVGAKNLTPGLSNVIAREFANVGVQMPIQATLGAAGEAGAQVAAGDPLNTREIAAEAAGEFVTAPLEVAAAGYVARREILADGAAKAEAAQNRQRLFEALASTESKLRDRAPEKFREFIETATRDGPVETVYIPADKFVAYFQGANADPAELLDKMPEVAAQLEVALASGADLAIPTSAFAAYVAPSPHYKGLAQDLRFNPDDMTMREAADWQKNSEALGKELEAAAKVDAEALPPGDQRIFEDVSAQLIGTGMEEGTAKRNATLIASVFKSLGERTGEDPKALFDRYGLKIERGGQFKEQSEVEKIVADDNLLTPILDDLRAAPAEPDAPATVAKRYEDSANTESLTEDFDWGTERVPLADVFAAMPGGEQQWREYAEKMVKPGWQSATTTPPVVSFEPGVTDVWDGGHRIAQAIARGDTEIDAVVGRKRAIAQSLGRDTSGANVSRGTPEEPVRSAPAEIASESAQPIESAAAARAQPEKSAPPEIQVGQAKGVAGRQGRVFIDDATGYQPTQFAVVDAAGLAPTMDKAENQYRDRNRAAGEAQVRAIATNLDFERLADSPLMDYGAPTLAADGRVIGGNGRLAGIRRAYDGGIAGGYRAALAARATEFGFTAADIEAMERPVLVRVLPEGIDIKKAAIASNEGGALQMSALEVAKVDAERIGELRDFEFDDQGQLAINRSMTGIRRWVGALPAQQRGAITDAQGALSAEGVRRVQNAILYRAYGDSPTLARLVDAVDSGSRNVAAALMRAAPAVADLRDGIAAGMRYPLDISQDIQQAVEKLLRIRESGQSVDEALRQQDLMGAQLSEEAEIILRFFGDSLRSSRTMAQFLERYHAAAEAAGSPQQGDIFGERTIPSKAELLTQATAAELANRMAAQQGGQSALFQSAPPVESDAFKAWFGESKVADEDGVPTRVFHATRADITEFKPNSWFAEDVGLAEKFYNGRFGRNQKGGGRRLYPLFLSIKNPFDTRSIGPITGAPVNADKIAKALGLSKAEYLEKLWEVNQDALKEMRTSPRWNEPGSPPWNLDELGGMTARSGESHQLVHPINLFSDVALFRVFDNPGFINLLKSLGYDGVLAHEIIPGRTPRSKDAESDTWMVFDSTQVKSATGNRGTFDPSSQNILFQGPAPRTILDQVSTADYFQRTARSVALDPNLLTPTHERPGAVDRAADRMRKSAEGNYTPRKPVDIVVNAKGELTVRDGNSTVLAARRVLNLPAVEAEIELELNDEKFRQYEQQLTAADKLKIADQARDAMEFLPTFTAELEDIAKATGAELIPPNLKAGFGFGRIAEKIITEQGGETTLKDMARSTLVVQDRMQAVAAVEAVLARFGQAANTSLRTTLLDATTVDEVYARDPYGYADVKVNVQGPNGRVYEVQFQSPELRAAGKARGHKLYERGRTLEGILALRYRESGDIAREQVGDVVGDQSAEEIELAEIKAESRAVYTPGLEAWFTRSSNSESASGAPSARTPDGVTARHLPPATRRNADSRLMNDGTPSTFQNVDPAGQMAVDLGAASTIQGSLADKGPRGAIAKALKKAGIDLKKATNKQAAAALRKVKLRQDAPQPRLSVVHNLTEENLAFSAELGGIAVPSLAVVPDGQTMRNYGGVTLIGDAKLADPETTPVFDADAYSATFPPAEYGKARQKDAQKLVDEFRPFAELFDELSIKDELWDNAVNRPNPQRTIDMMLRNPAGIAWFLDSIGIKVEPVMQDRQIEYTWVQFPAFQKFLAEHDGEVDFDYDDTASRKAMAEAATAAFEENLADRIAKDPAMAEVAEFHREIFKEHTLDEDGLIPFGYQMRISRSLDAIGKQRVGYSETQKVVEGALAGHEAEFKTWLEDKILPLHGPPKLTVGRKKVPYTLDNIVEHMTKGPIRGKEKTMTFGEGHARAASSAQIKSLVEMRNRAEWQIKGETEVDEARETSKKMLEAWRSDVIEFYSGQDWRGNVDTWNALDASMRALARWAKGKGMAEALRAEGFRGVPEDVIKAGKEAGNAFLSAPVPYFEAKPQRAVGIGEFAGAVIPDSATEKTRQILTEAGVPFREYKTGEGIDRETSRAGVVNSFRTELAGQGKSVLFQSSILEQAAYHGSPYDFDRFSLSKIGTGEGAQAYGWGLYFAENEKVAEGYSKAGDHFVEIDGKKVNAMLTHLNLPSDGVSMAEKYAANAIWRFKGNKDEAIEFLSQKGNMNDELAGAKILRNAKDIKTPQGSLYQVEIPDAAVDRMIDGDEFIGLQPPAIMRAIRKIIPSAQPEWTGNDAYARIVSKIEKYGEGDKPFDALTEQARDFGIVLPVGDWDERDQARMLREFEKRSDDMTFSELLRARAILSPKNADQIASETLNELGIPGIKYKDADSRQISTKWNTEGSVGAVEERRQETREAANVALQASRGNIPEAIKALRTDSKTVFAALTAAGRSDFHDPYAAAITALKNGDLIVDPGTRNLVVFDDTIVEVTHKNGKPLTKAERAEFLQKSGNPPGWETAETRDPSSPDPMKPHRGTRGMMGFGSDRQMTITLFETADLSTILHESGHFYLEVLKDIASRPDAPQQIKDDFDSLLTWFGVDGGIAAWNAMPIEAQRPHHEQFARGFEAYLFEGKAPNADLQGLFARFRAWLVSIYRKAEALNVKLNPKIREVFDRLVATDDEIRAAREAQNYVELFTTAEEAGYSETEFTAYRAAMASARTEAEERLTIQVLAELTREQKAWWGEERAKLEAEVTAEVHANPVYRALAFLQHGTNPDGTPFVGMDPVKLSRAAIVDMHGKAFLKTLPRPYVYSREGGVAPDVIAPMFGFDSGDALLQAIVGARSMRTAIREETDARMRAKHGEVLIDGSLVDKAMEAVHNDRQADLLAAELKALRRLERTVAPALRARDLSDARARRAEQADMPNADERRAITRAAEQAIAAKRIRDINPHAYRVAEARASRAAFEAAGKGDYSLAYMEKRKQLLNHELYRAATAAKADAEKIREYMRGFEETKTRARLGRAGGDYLEQIDDILDRFDFRRISNRTADKRLALAAWVAERQKAGQEVNLPPWLLDESKRMPFRQLSYEQLQGVRDAVVNIDHLSKLKNRLLTAQENREYDSVRDGIVTAIDANHQRKEVPFEFTPEIGDNIKHGMAEGIGQHTKMEFLFNWLDGNIPGLGPVWKALFKPLADAENQEQVLQRAARDALQAIFSRYTAKERRAMFRNRQLIPEIGKSMNKATLLAVALNTGNQYNRDVLLKGYKWSDAQLRAVLTRLDDRDWETVQMIWDHLESYWPAIRDLQKDLTGLAPAKVERTPFQSPTGRNMAGGYYPIVYDSRLSWRQKELDATAGVTELYGGAYARVSTRHGHTIERTNSGGKAPKLDLSVFGTHIVNVIHDITHRRALLDVDRLVTDDVVREAIEQTAGREMWGQLRPWLKSIAADFKPNMTIPEAALNHLRAGATVVSMGLKLTTALVQPLGYFQTVEVLGPKYSAIGLREVYGRGNPVKALTRARAFAFERSEQIRNRMHTFDRDVREAIKGMGDMGAERAAIRRGFFFLTGLTDMSVALPTWIGAYRKAMDGEARGLTAGNELEAIDYADSILRTTQSAGGAKDLAMVQAGHPILKLFTTFYSYFNVLFNLMARRMRMMNFKKPSDYPRFVASMVALWFIPAVLSEIVAGRGPDDDEDWEDYVKRSALSWATYPLQSIVFVRDIIDGMGPYGYDGPPALDAITQTARAVGTPEGGGATLGTVAGAAITRSPTGAAIGAALGGTIGALAVDEDLTRAELEATFEAIGYWGHLPSKQMWITGSYLYDWATGDENPESLAEVAEGVAFARRGK